MAVLFDDEIEESGSNVEPNLGALGQLLQQGNPTPPIRDPIESLVAQIAAQNNPQPLFQQEVSPWGVKPEDVVQEPTIPIRDVGVVEAATTPLISLPRSYPGPTDPMTEGIAGLQRALAGLVEGFTSPLGLATLNMGWMKPTTQRAVSGGFAADMARHTPEIARELGTAVGSGDVGGMAEHGLGALANTFFAAKAGGHAIEGPGKMSPGEMAGRQLQDSIPLATKEVGVIEDLLARDMLSPERAQVETAIMPEASRPRELTITPEVLRQQLEIREGGIGRGLKDAVEKNQEAGSVMGPGELGKAVEVERPMFHREAPFLLRDRAQSGFNPQAKIDGTQLFNRLKNKLTPGEVEGLEAAGVREFLKEKRTPEELAKWVEGQEGVEVRELRADGSTQMSESQKKLAEIEHKLDTLNPDWRRSSIQDLPPEAPALINEFHQWREKAGQDVKSNESATARYTMVNPKPLDKMPGAVDLLVRVPRKVKTGRELERGFKSSGNPNEMIENPKYTSSHYPTEGKNLLAHVRGYMETTPDGKKVFHVFEVQSDWAQAQREARQEFIDKGLKAGKKTREELEKLYAEKPTFHDDPLLRHYERLALKAAIDHARKQGADAIALSDAETAMLTEGHDRAYTEALDSDSPSGPPQEKGMRLHYDQTLPKIAEELTGSKGERVDFGEHKNARPDVPNRVIPDPTPEQPGRVRPLELRDIPIRPDLIFRNPDGTPKTSISARLYPLTNARKSFSLYGSDKAAKPPMEKKGLKIEPQSPESGFIRLPQHLRHQTTQSLTGRFLPDFQPKAKANREFSEKFASDKIPVLGRAMGGKWRIRSPQDEALAAWYAERHGVGPATASALAEQIKGEINDVFKVDSKGDMNVQPLMPGQSLKVADVFEELQRNPGAYTLTPEQSRVLKNVITPIMGRMKELVTRHKLVDPTGEYFMRAPVERTVEVDKPSRGNTVGVEQGFQKERYFDTEREGWEAGVKYETDVEARLVRGVQDMYRAIADSRLAQDPALQGVDRNQLEQRLRSQFPNKTADEIRKLANIKQQDGSVNARPFFGRIYDREIAQRLNKEFASEASTIRKTISNVNSFAKALTLGFDFGAGQIQLLPTFFNNPRIWAQSQATAMGAFASKDVFPEYARKNIQYIRELVRYGSSVGKLEEYMSGMGGGGLLTKGPEKLGEMLAGDKGKAVGKVVGDVPRAFGRHFQTSLDVAKVELWKAWREVTPKKEWAKTIQAIESTLLSGRMESGMVPHGRALTERVLLMAPSYYRGAVNFIAALGESGVSGKVARQAMGKFMLGSIAMYHGVGQMLGMKDEELKERLDPRQANFMLWRVKNGDRDLEVGPGGIFRSWVRMVGNVVKTSQDRPGDWKSLAPDKNPFTRWYRGHAAPLPAKMWDQFTGKDFLSRESDLTTLPGGMLPLAIQGEGTMKEKALKTVGFTTIPAKNPTAKEIAKELFGTEKVETLNRAERIKLSKEVTARKGPQTMEEKRLSAERAMKYDFERKESLNAAMSKESREWLNKHQLELPSYRPQQQIRGTKINFTQAEKEFMFKEVVKGYEEALTQLRGQGDFDRIGQRVKEARMDRLMSRAREKALRALQAARQSGSIIEQDSE